MFECVCRRVGKPEIITLDARAPRHLTPRIPTHNPTTQPHMGPWRAATPPPFRKHFSIDYTIVLGAALLPQLGGSRFWHVDPGVGKWRQPTIHRGGGGGSHVENCRNAHALRLVFPFPHPLRSHPYNIDKWRLSCVNISHTRRPERCER